MHDTSIVLLDYRMCFLHIVQQKASSIEYIATFLITWHCIVYSMLSSVNDKCSAASQYRHHYSSCTYQYHCAVSFMDQREVYVWRTCQCLCEQFDNHVLACYYYLAIKSQLKANCDNIKYLVYNDSALQWRGGVAILRNRPTF